LVDLAALDLSKDVVSQDELRTLVPQREEFQMVDGICHLDLKAGVVVGYKDWGKDAWWARGHIPGRPLMPGVLMIESAAQVATLLIKRSIGWGSDQMIGLGGLNDVRFRGQVVPPTRVYLIAGNGRVSGRRLAKYTAQVACQGELVMEMELLGVLL
jgi:3-hydroxyacyl-[acyl-carrier-protein] dehydratase